MYSVLGLVFAMSEVSIKDLLVTCLLVVSQVCEIVRQVAASGSLDVVEKGEALGSYGVYDDPQTEADRRAERLIKYLVLSSFCLGTF